MQHFRMTHQVSVSAERFAAFSLHFQTLKGKTWNMTIMTSWSALGFRGWFSGVPTAWFMLNHRCSSVNTLLLPIQTPFVHCLWVSSEISWGLQIVATCLVWLQEWYIYILIEASAIGDWSSSSQHFKAVERSTNKATDQSPCCRAFRIQVWHH